MQTNLKEINKKLLYIFKGIIFFIFLIFLRLFYLQVGLKEKFYQLSQKNYTRIVKIVSPRGNITDTNGHLLATNRQVLNIYWHGTGNKKLSLEQNDLINNLQEIINVKFDDEVLKKININERHSKNVLLANDIAFEKLGQILEKFPSNNNLEIETKFQRFYPKKTIASHIIGYLSQIDEETIGKMGIEKILEDNLKGNHGEIETIINSLGKSLDEKEIKSPASGKTIKTTLDLHLQTIAEETFPEQYKGALIIMDPRNGAIRTTVSRPNFDPSVFLKQLTLEEWQEFQEQQPFLNRAFNACYPPASLFKLISVTAALDTGIIRRESNWICRGFTTFAGRRYHCNKREGHGFLSTAQAVGLSCNPFFYEIAKKIDIDTLADYAKRFGLGQKTGTIFSEKEGLVPTASWKKKTIGEKWWKGENLSAVIGQSYLLVTPIQMVRMISSIFEGYLVKPRIMEDQPVEITPLNIPKDILEFLRLTMNIASSVGTAQRIGRIRDINVSGKTGTAQTISFETQGDSKEILEHAWLAANFSYKNNPTLTMIILIEKAGHSRVAVEVAKQLLVKYRNLMKDLENNKFI